MADTGAVTTFGALDAASNRIAHVLRGAGLGIGAGVALLMGNNARFFEVAWAAQRAGLYLTCLSTRLTLPEIVYIVRDSGARALIIAADLCLAGLAEALPGIALYVDGGGCPGFQTLDPILEQASPDPIADERCGAVMLYSSGTTGRPKGVRTPLPECPDIGVADDLERLAAGRLGFDQNTVYLCPAPLYHAAPLRWSMVAQKLGGTVVVMEKFDAEHTLALIGRYRITHAQYVPTHFVRMLKLPTAVRERHDLSSQRLAIHAAAPCPVPIKEAMIDWWGDIVLEYYAGTEFNGLTVIDSAEWRAHPGSVGRALIGTVKICDDAGNELPVGEVGTVYFVGGNDFEYHNDAAATAASRNDKGWTTLGDVGRVDGEGYLYLTDRKSFMIISGGVNVYPQEVEDLLLTHPQVVDAAVFGVPDDDLGERVVAVVQPVDMSQAGAELAESLTAWMRERLSSIKLPRRVDFRAELPRHATGKLYKRLLRDEYIRGEPQHM